MNYVTYVCVYPPTQISLTRKKKKKRLKVFSFCEREGLDVSMVVVRYVTFLITLYYYYYHKNKFKKKKTPKTMRRKYIILKSIFHMFLSSFFFFNFKNIVVSFHRRFNWYLYLKFFLSSWKINEKILEILKVEITLAGRKQTT